MRWVESDPGWGQHEVNVSFISEAPIFEDAFQVELADYLMCGQNSVHVGLQTKLSVDASLIELDLNKAVRVRSYDKVDLGPIYHNDLLNIVDNIWELLLGHSLHALVHLCWFELSMQDFVLFDPF